MTRIVYSLLMWLAQPFMLARLKRRGVAEPGYLLALDERLGFYGASALPVSKPGFEMSAALNGASGGASNADTAGCVWIHAVSLGETRAADPLIVALRAQVPGLRLLLTHGTATGRAEGAKLVRTGDAQAWMPWDTPSAAKRFLKHFKPQLGILMETEVWPNVAATCQALNIPLVLANARMSDKSLRTSLQLGWLSKPAYRSLAAVWAQTEPDAERLRQIGAPVQGVFGNIKFDATPNPTLLAQGRALRQTLTRPVVMLAVSREGEEAALLACLQQQLQGCKPTSAQLPCIDANSVQWLIVPRHPQRFEEVAGLISSHGFGLSRRSQWPKGQCPVQDAATDTATVWLGDSLGEMALYYGLADVALLGGSFEELGGQNLIEAAACATPVVMGPHTFNFAEAAELAQAAGAALRVNTLDEAVTVAVDLAHNTRLISRIRSSALAFAEAHRGATARLAHAIAALLPKSG